MRKEAYGWSVDWWGLGAVIYEMLHGLPPFYSHTNNQREMFDKILYKPVNFRATASQAARDIVMSVRIFFVFLPQNFSSFNSISFLKASS